MGKYTRKPKLSPEVSVTELSSGGVLTRARTLALQRLRNCYLQLRSRRLDMLFSPPKLKPTTTTGAAGDDDTVEVSLDDNVLDLEVRDRDARETTPCSETVRTPGSATRPRSTTTSRRMPSSIQRNMPTAQEVEEFFAPAEQLHQRLFAEKYNFDPVNDCPLVGRFEWEKLDC